jgi:mono/diheme cytochrome c family protein
VYLIRLKQPPDGFSHAKCLREVLFAALVFAFVGYPTAARAIPLFANAQGGVSCQTCHNVPPNLNAYGRFILATNFMRGIDSHAQMKNNLRDPISLLFTDDESNQNPPHVPTNYSFFDAAVSGGYFGPKVTYYAAIPAVENGFPATSVYQSWIAYNGFSNGNGSLRVGKFATPFLEPWLGLPAVSLTAYAPAVLTVGQNTVGLGENRWGASYTQSSANGLIATVGYMTDQGPIESAYNSQKVLGPQFLGPPGNQGSSYVASLLYMQPSSRLTGGVAFLGGQFPLTSGGKDPYTREMLLASYNVTQQITLTAMKLFGHDNNPTGSPRGPSTSNGWSIGTLFNPTQWAHVELRSERTNDGLGLSAMSYVTAVAFNPIANMSITIANVATVGHKPYIAGELAWTGPWYRHQGPPPAPAVAVGGGGSPGAADFAAHCAACHGASGGGGVGPSLIGIANRRTLDSTVAFIENPSGGIMPKLYPSQLTATQVQQIAAYIRTFGSPGAAPGAAPEGGAQVFAAHCAMCHGANGEGGVGPNLHGIATRKTLAQTVAFIENPSGGIMPKLYPSQITEAQVQQVAAYIQTLK